MNAIGGPRPRWDRFSIESKLRESLEKAKERSDSCTVEFQLALKQVPGGLPASDGQLHFHKVSQEYREALQEYRSALKRFTDFVVNGVVPDDFR